MSTAQLTLGLSLRDDATFANYYPSNNENIIQFLQAFVVGQNEQFIFLWGQPGVGRTHLLQACCHEAASQHRSSIYLPMKEHDTLQPEVLDGLEAMDLICIDDIEAVLKNRVWEEALFHCYNRARELGTRLLVVGDCVPTRLPCQMPDLRSRLAWGLMLQVDGLNDADKLSALQMRSRHRGIELSSEVGQFLMRHYPRDMTALFAALETLDRASLQAKRRLTIPFVKSVLHI